MNADLLGRRVTARFDGGSVTGTVIAVTESGEGQLLLNRRDDQGGPRSAVWVPADAEVSAPLPPVDCAP